MIAALLGGWTSFVLRAESAAASTMDAMRSFGGVCRTGKACGWSGEAKPAAPAPAMHE